MRIYGDPYELMSEVLRDLDEMAIIVKPKSMQNKKIEGNPDFYTKEIQNYVYSLVDMGYPDPLFVFEDSKEWAEAEFRERFSAVYRNPGEAWKIRPDMWEQFLVDGKFDYAYNARINHQYNFDLIKNELKANPDSRQCWMPIFFPEDVQFLGGKRRIPCSLGYYFMVRENKVNMTYVQRSADAVAHFGNDVWLAWQAMDFMARGLELETGILTHHIFSLHSYRKDWDALNRGIVGLTKKPHETK